MGDSNNQREANSLLSWLQRPKASPSQQFIDNNQNAQQLSERIAKAKETSGSHESNFNASNDSTLDDRFSKQVDDKQTAKIKSDQKKNVDKASAMNIQFNKSLQYFHANNQRRVKCRDCLEFPDIVKLHSSNNKPPPITTERGTKFLEEIVRSHLSSVMHDQCHKAHQQSLLKPEEISIKTPIGRSINQANLALANHIGQLMLHVYGGVKKLTISGNTFPARVLTCKIAEDFNFEEYQREDYEYNLQYVTPASFREILKVIVESHQSNLAELLSDSLALSLRCDGSVDRVQIDKIFTMMKSINKDGSEHLYFLGAAEPKEKGAPGLLGTVKTGISNTVGTKQTNQILQKVSSVVTDGASINTGEKAGFWQLLEDFLKTLSSTEEQHPLLKLWCSLHRSELAWKDVTKNISDIKLILDKAVGLTSFFRVSGMRTKELKQIAEENKLILAKFPGYFEIRWAEFTSQLITAILKSWHPLILYFQKLKVLNDAEGIGFLNFLLEKNNLERLTFMSDVLEVLSRLQKNLQRDNTTVVDMLQYVSYTCDKLKNLPNEPLLGGWVNALNEQVEKMPDGSYTLKGIPLIAPRPRRKIAHKTNVTEKRSPDAVNLEVALTLSNYLQNRFEMNEEVGSLLKKFLDFDPSVDLTKIHETVAADSDLVALGIEFSELVSIGMGKSFKNKTLIEKIQRLITLNEYPTVTKILARIAAFKPHSADVERLISCSNAVKTADRSSMHIDTENLYLYIYFNMPTLDMWDPRPAVDLWLKKKERRQKDHPKAKEQPWYHGIFKQSAKQNHEDDDECDTNEPPLKKRCF